MPITASKNDPNPYALGLKHALEGGECPYDTKSYFYSFYLKGLKAGKKRKKK